MILSQHETLSVLFCLSLRVGIDILFRIFLKISFLFLTPMTNNDGKQCTGITPIKKYFCLSINSANRV